MSTLVCFTVKFETQKQVLPSEHKEWELESWVFFSALPLTSYVISVFQLFDKWKQ